MNSPQHKWMGDHFESSFEGVYFRRTERGQQRNISFGDVCALSGDYINSYREIRDMYHRAVNDALLSDTNRFVSGAYTAMQELLQDGNSLYSAEQRDGNRRVPLRGFVALRAPRSPVQLALEGLRGGFMSLAGESPGLLLLARTNWYHFHPISQNEAWSKLHDIALHIAKTVPIQVRERMRPSGSGQSEFCFDRHVEANRRKFAMALFVEACADHFLMDSFTAGHVRTQRIFAPAAIVDGAAFAANWCKASHDIDNHRQLRGRNSLGRNIQMPGEYADVDDFYTSGGRISGQSSRFSQLKSALKISVESLFTIQEGSDRGHRDDTIEYRDERLPRYRVTNNIKRICPRTSIYWIPLEQTDTDAYEDIENEGYRFHMEGFNSEYLNDRTLVLHVDLGNTLPPPPPVYTIVAKLHSDNRTLRDHKFATLNIEWSGEYCFGQGDHRYRVSEPISVAYDIMSGSSPNVGEGGVPRFYPIPSTNRAHRDNVLKKFNNCAIRGHPIRENNTTLIEHFNIQIEI